jgi:hypothetical protein
VGERRLTGAMRFSRRTLGYAIRMDREPMQPSLDADGIPDHEGPLNEKARTGDGQEGVYPPGDRYHGADRYGTTAAEEETGESLDDKLSRELPDPANAVEGTANDTPAADHRIQGT